METAGWKDEPLHRTLTRCVGQVGGLRLCAITVLSVMSLLVLVCPELWAKNKDVDKSSRQVTAIPFSLYNNNLIVVQGSIPCQCGKPDSRHGNNTKRNLKRNRQQA